MTNPFVVNHKETIEDSLKDREDPNPEMQIIYEALVAAANKRQEFINDNGQYSLTRAAKIICKKVGKVYADIISELVEGFDAGIFNLYLPGSYAQADKLNLSHAVHWNELNTWLIKSYPSLNFKFPTPTISISERTKAEAIYNASSKQQIRTNSSENDWGDQAIKKILEEAILAYDNGEKSALSKITTYISSNGMSQKHLAQMFEIINNSSNIKRAKAGGNGKAAKLTAPKNHIIKKWSSGNFKSRDWCAEQEYSALGFGSIKAARNALINTPDPSPWPAKNNS